MKLRLETIEVEGGACFNHLNNKLVCWDCVDSCPKDAIKINEQIPVINHSSCINCGLCVSRCKALAIDHIQRPYTNISEEIKNHPNFNITCDQLVRYQKGIKIPCYLSMDIPLILQQNNGKETVDFYIEGCRTCPKTDFISVERHAAMLQKELEELQIPITIKLINTRLDDNTYDQAVNGLSRRELFQKLSIKNMREMLIDRGDGLKQEKKKALTLNERTKFKRQLFNNYLNRNSKNLSTEKVLPSKDFIMLTVSNTCRGCNVCESICPTKAIKWQTKENEGKLLFSVQNCIACRKCLVCPEQAINFQSIELNSYLNIKEAIELIGFQVKYCQKCGDQFRPKENENLCSCCDKLQKKDSNQFFAHYLE